MVTFIYSKRVNQTNRGKAVLELEHTFAYEKMAEDKFLIVSVTHNGYDSNDKNLAKKYAIEKLERIKSLITRSQGRVLPEGRNFYKILSSESLKELKRNIFDRNQKISQIVDLYSGVSESKWFNVGNEKSKKNKTN